MNNIMASKAIKFLEEHQSETPSRFAEEAHLAACLGVSPQYVSKLLSGTENLSFKSVANIEDKLGISCFAMM